MKNGMTKNRVRQVGLWKSYKIKYQDINSVLNEKTEFVIFNRMLRRISRQQQFKENY